MAFVPNSEAQAPNGESYTVQADDWLSKLADKFYGNPQSYPVIVEATNAKAKADDHFTRIDQPGQIEMGQLLWIPELPGSPPSSPKAETGTEGVGDSLYPGLGNGGYDVQHYTLDLTVDMATNIISGTTTVEAIATQDLTAFNLDLFGLEVSDIQVDGTSVVFHRMGSELTITPPHILSEAESFTTTITYGGEPTPIRDPAVPFTALGWLRARNSVYVVSEPSGAMSWYPVNNHPLDKAMYTFRITVAKPFVVAANGLLESEIDNGDTTTYIWQMEEPMASYLATVNIGEYQRVTDTGPNGLLIRNYFPPDTDPQIISAFDSMPEMITFYSDLLGPYPFEVYGIIMVDKDLGFALETQTLSIFGWRNTDESTIAHELMHQWLGNSVSLADWQDIWLNEGFSEYFSLLWLEHKHGSEILTQQMDFYYQALTAERAAPPATVPIDELFSATVYLRGAWTLHALRLEVGDETFFEILRTYSQRFQHQSVTTDDFIAIVNEVSGQDLTDFLQDWLYDEVLPPHPEGE